MQEQQQESNIQWAPKRCPIRSLFAPRFIPVIYVLHSSAWIRVPLMGDSERRLLRVLPSCCPAIFERHHAISPAPSSIRGKQQQAPPWLMPHTDAANPHTYDSASVKCTRVIFRSFRKERRDPSTEQTRYHTIRPAHGTRTQIRRRSIASFMVDTIDGCDDLIASDEGPTDRRRRLAALLHCCTAARATLSRSGFS